MRCLLCTLALVLFVGCQTQATGVANPFLAPDRVPPPATRAQLPGTVQPYYPGDAAPNISIQGAPSAYQPTQTYAPQPVTPQPVTPQPAGVAPPGGWNTTPQPYNRGASTSNVLPSNVQPVGAVMPMAGQTPIQVQQDQFGLRFAQPAPAYQPTMNPSGQSVMTDPSVLPTTYMGASPTINQSAGFQAQVAQPVAQNVAPRQVQIRAISSAGIGDDGQATGAGFSSDGFRPQGSSRVRKPAISVQNVPRERGPLREASDRFGFEPGYQWLRGQLQYSSSTGQWTLRYVPIQGAADQFGGSLTISNPQLLGNLQPGDFVHLRGQLEGASIGAPNYTVSVVQRQRI